MEGSGILFQSLHVWWCPYWEVSRVHVWFSGTARSLIYTHLLQLVNNFLKVILLFMGRGYIQGGSNVIYRRGVCWDSGVFLV